MAKRTPPRLHDNDTSSDAPSRPAARRKKSTAPPASPPDTLGVYTGVEGMEHHRNEPSEEKIRARAYQRYLERGGTGGSDFEDWLEAERELRRSQSES